MHLIHEFNPARDEFAGHAWGFFAGAMCVLGVDLITSRSGFILAFILFNRSLGIASYR